MARLSRFCPAGHSFHVIQRGNDRSACFADEADYANYLDWLTDYSRDFDVAVHAWVLMTNHVHMLVTPSAENGVSLMMQALGRRYVRYFNRRYRRTGTLWEGRFKSCLVQTGHYWMRCCQYIELNPVRAGMVAAPLDYPYSSHQSNAYGVSHALWTPHSEYLSLGESAVERLTTYRSLLMHNLHDLDITQIRQSVNSGIALGTSRFKDEIERLYGRRVQAKTMGRPKKVSSDPT